VQRKLFLTLCDLRGLASLRFVFLFGTGLSGLGMKTVIFKDRPLARNCILRANKAAQCSECYASRACYSARGTIISSNALVIGGKVAEIARFPTL